MKRICQPSSASILGKRRSGERLATSRIGAQEGVVEDQEARLAEKPSHEGQPDRERELVAGAAAQRVGAEAGAVGSLDREAAVVAAALTER